MVSFLCIKVQVGVVVIAGDCQSLIRPAGLAEGDRGVMMGQWVRRGNRAHGHSLARAQCSLGLSFFLRKAARDWCPPVSTHAQVHPAVIFRAARG